MSYKYFENKDCEFYPCHNTKSLNCLFCFCPLYDLDCGGNFKMIETNDSKTVKDCSGCLIPHSEKGYEYIINMLSLKQAEERGV